MKKLKRMMMLGISCLLALTMGIAASAATIKVSNSQAGATYNAYKIFDADYAQDGKAAYTLDARSADGQAIYAAFQTDAVKDDATIRKPFAFSSSGTEGIYNVTLIKDYESFEGDTDTKDVASDETIVNYIREKVTALNLTPAATGLGNDSEITLKHDGSEEVDPGYYYVSTTSGAVITILNAAATAKVFDKNTVPTWDEEPGSGEDGYGKVITNSDIKYLDENNNEITDRTRSTANYGDTVSFSIGVNAVGYVGGEKVSYYYIQDKLAAGLTYDQESVKVYVNNTEYRYDEDGVPEYNEYSISWKENADGTSQFEIIVFFTDITTTDNVIKVTYDALLNQNAVIAGNGNLNTANYTYTTAYSDRDPDYDPIPLTDGDKIPYDETNEISTRTYTFALGVLKTDAEGNALSGAEFNLTDKEGHAIPVSGSNGVYSYDAGSASNTVVSPDNGIILVKGLKAGKYELTETKAPAGYNKLGEAVEMEASLDQIQTYTETITTYFNAEGEVVFSEVENGSSQTVTTPVKVVPVTVVNHAGIVLPSTGGTGTVMFYLFGGIIVLAAGMMLLISRKKC